MKGTQRRRVFWRLVESPIIVPQREPSLGFRFLEHVQVPLITKHAPPALSRDLSQIPIVASCDTQVCSRRLYDS